jgi:hypothetical protein
MRKEAIATGRVMTDKEISPIQRLQTFATMVNTEPSESLAVFCGRFEPQLRHFLELGIQLDPLGVGCVTLGCGEEFGRSVGGYLVEMGLDDSCVQDVLELQRSVDEWMLVRVIACANEDPEVGIYFRRAISVDKAVHWLAERGVNAAEQAALKHLSLLIGSNRTGIFAARFKKNEPVYYKAFLSLYTEDNRADGRLLFPVFDHFQVPRYLWKTFLDNFAALGNLLASDVYLSLLLGDGDAFDSLKLDIFQVNLAAFESLLRQSNLFSDNLPSPVELGRYYGLTEASHCGLRFDKNGCGTTIYFTPQ